jgi:hypothetical protein
MWKCRSKTGEPHSFDCWPRNETDGKCDGRSNDTKKFATAQHGNLPLAAP